MAVVERRLSSGPERARGGNDKRGAVMEKDEKQHLSNEAKQWSPLAPARGGDAPDPQRQLSPRQLCCLSGLAHV